MQSELVLFKAIEYSHADFLLSRVEKKSVVIPNKGLTKETQVSVNKYPLQKSIINNYEIYNGIKQGSNKWIELACDLAHISVLKGGGPFGSVVVQVDSLSSSPIRYWQSINQVTILKDPTAHAEVLGIRSVCEELGVVNLGEIRKEESNLEQPNELSHCIVYSSCEPCPMCYSAISWARVHQLYFAATRYDAAVDGVNFSDEAIYRDIKLPYHKRDLIVCQCDAPNALAAFNLWKNIEKDEY